jgi:hypothetical protein
MLNDEIVKKKITQKDKKKKVINRMGIKIKIKNKLEGNYKFLIEG